MTKNLTPNYVLSRCLIVLLISTLMNACTDENVKPPQTDSSVQSNQHGVTEFMQQTFTAHLTGDQERPNPVDTDASGQAIFKLSKDGTSLSYKVIVTNLEDITQAHIHCGGPDVAGPVITFLFGFDPAGITVNGVLAEGTITNADIIARPESEQCMGGIANFDQLIEKLKAGQAYINVHTISYPAGEIRGQIN